MPPKRALARGTRKRMKRHPVQTLMLNTEQDLEWVWQSMQGKWWSPRLHGRNVSIVTQRPYPWLHCSSTVVCHYAWLHVDHYCQWMLLSKYQVLKLRRMFELLLINTWMSMLRARSCYSAITYFASNVSHSFSVFLLFFLWHPVFFYPTPFQIFNKAAIEPSVVDQ